jgi:hypothetical protein
MAKKSPKKAAKKTPEDLSRDEAFLNRLRVANETRMTALERMIEDAGGEDSERTHDKIRAEQESLRISGIAISAEQRQLEKHTRTMLDALSPDDTDAIVREYLEELPRGRRKAFLELLQGLDSSNDLLSL